MRLIVLTENSVYRRGLLAEHGWAVWVEREGRAFLFDAGQTSLVLTRNAEALGVRLGEAEGILLSHGHYDHAGGLPAALAAARDKQTVWLHRDALAPKFSCPENGRAHEVGLPQSAREALNAKAVLRFVEGPAEAAPGIFVTGPVPRQTDFEDTGGPFFLDPKRRRADPLLDDQALFIEESDGITVLLGCAHAGVINTLLHIRELTGARRPFKAVLGGAHLVNASERRLRRTAEELRALGVRRLFPAHCTGVPAIARLWRELPGVCAPCSAGLELASAA